MNANILYLATCKIAREQHHGPGFVDLALELHGGVISDTFKKFFRRLATEVSENNDIFLTALQFHIDRQKRMSTTLQRMNALILRSTQVKISKRLGMLCEGEVDLNDRIYAFVVI